MLEPRRPRRVARGSVGACAHDEILLTTPLEKRRRQRAVSCFSSYAEPGELLVTSRSSRWGAGHFEQVCCPLARMGVAFRIRCRAVAGQLNEGIRGARAERLVDTLLCSRSSRRECDHAAPRRRSTIRAREALRGSSTRARHHETYVELATASPRRPCAHAPPRARAARAPCSRRTPIVRLHA